jgi:hypothetical protein
LCRADNGQGNEYTELRAAADGQERSRFGEAESTSWARLETRGQAGQRWSRDEAIVDASGKWGRRSTRKAAETAKQQGKLCRVLIGGRGPKRLYVIAGS